VSWTPELEFPNVRSEKRTQMLNTDHRPTHARLAVLHSGATP